MPATTITTAETIIITTEIEISTVGLCSSVPENSQWIHQGNRRIINVKMVSEVVVAAMQFRVTVLKIVTKVTVALM
jgi:hypothetical protein